MTKLQKKTKIFFIVALVALFIFSIISTVNAADTIYSETTTAKSRDVVYFEKPESWGNVAPYIYVWNNESNNSWPGSSMTNVEGNLYQYTFPDNTPSYKKLIFNNGSDAIKTSDLDYICNGFVYNTETIKKVEEIAFSIKTLKSGDTIYFEKPDSWDDTTYIYMWNNSTGKNNTENGDWNTKPAMTHIFGNLYSYTLTDTVNNVSDGFDYVIFTGFENGTQKQTKDLCIVGKSLTFKANNYTISNSGNDYGKYDGNWYYDQDKTSLATLISNTTLPTGDEVYYTEDSYTIYNEQFNLAKTVVNSKYVTATFSDLTSQYDKSLIALPLTYDNLKISTEKLDDKVKEMEEVDTSKYDPSLVDAFHSSIQEGKTFSDDYSNKMKDMKITDNITAKEKSKAIADMETLISNMETAYNNLVVDKTELESLINKAKEIDTTLYTDESAQNLLDAITSATEIYENPDASYYDVQEQITKLNNAISKLVLKENAEDTNTTEETSEQEKAEKSGIISNPHTGDIIVALVIILAIAAIACTSTTIYLKKHKNNKK